MSSFDEKLIATAPAFVNSLGETVVYTPYHGTPRTIKAVVDRNPPQRITASGELVTPTMTVTVVNSATTGIASSELNDGGSDKITVAHRPGATAQDFGVYIPKDATPFADAGMITLDLK